MFIYFLRGTLPWRACKGTTVDETWDMIREKKRETELVLTVGLPEEFDTLYKYARALGFDDTPDYEGLRALFRGLAQKKRIEYDWKFDWTVGKPHLARRRFCAACDAKRRVTA